MQMLQSDYLTIPALLVDYRFRARDIFSGESLLQARKLKVGTHEGTSPCDFYG